MTSHNDRPLWRIGTKTLANELKRRGDAEAVQRTFLQECDLTLLLEAVRARGYHVIPPDLPANWPPLADEDEPLPFEVRDE